LPLDNISKYFAIVKMIGDISNITELTNYDAKSIILRRHYIQHNDT